jgi:hypothetical protein
VDCKEDCSERENQCFREFKQEIRP